MDRLTYRPRGGRVIKHMPSARRSRRAVAGLLAKAFAALVRVPAEATPSIASDPAPAAMTYQGIPAVAPNTCHNSNLPKAYVTSFTTPTRSPI